MLALLPLLFHFIPATQREVAASEEGFQPIFNGKDLSGWEGLPGSWEVRDGAIVGESTEAKPVAKTHYLYWKGGEPADFEVRFQYRISGHANTGLQFRSEARPDFNTWGYQADLDAQGRYTGCLYQHGRGLVAQRGQKVLIDAQGKKTVTKFAEPNELLKAVNRDGWNEYHVLAEGPRIMLSINGVRMCEVEDHEVKYALPKGILALQMHKGLPMKAEFKNLRLRVIK
jgi:hypothetical protein